MEKRADTSVAAIVAIVLGVVVVVFLIFGFSTGWGTLWDRITNTAGGSSNIDAVRSGCEVACLSKGTQQFCSDVRDVNYGKDAEDGVVRNDSGTCDYISKNPEEFPGLVVPRCSQISCPPPTP